MTKKILAILVVLFICVSVFAEMTDVSSVPTEKSNWSVYGGTSYFFSHLGVSYDIGRLQLGGTFYSGFPNIAIITYSKDIKEYNNMEEEAKKEATKPKFTDYIATAFKLAYMGNFSVLFDVTRGNKVDFFVGGAISGAYSNLGKALKADNDAKIGVVALDAVAKIKFNFAKHSGIYIATELPLGGVLFSPDSENEGKTAVNFFTVGGLDEYFTVLLMFLAYTTRVGYVYSF